MRGSVESPFEAQLQETVAMELNTGVVCLRLLPHCYNLVKLTMNDDN